METNAPKWKQVNTNEKNENKYIRVHLSAFVYTWVRFLLPHYQTIKLPNYQTTKLSNYQTIKLYLPNELRW